MTNVSIHLRDILHVICCSVLKSSDTVASIAYSFIPNIVNDKKNNVLNFLFLYISDLFYFVVNKKVKILSHELNSLHHSLKKKKQHKITNHITKNRIGKYSNHINSPLTSSNPPLPPLSPPTLTLPLTRSNSSTKTHYNTSVSISNLKKKKKSLMNILFA